MKNLRILATPLTVGAFVVVGATGLAMFFHANTSLGKWLHEWLGWLLVIVAVLHVVVNWTAMKGHLKRISGGLIIGLFAVVTVVALIPTSGAGGGANPNEAMSGALSAILRTPLRELSPVAGRDVDALMADLKAAGFANATADSTCEQLAGRDRGKQFMAIKALFPANGGAQGRAR